MCVGFPMRVVAGDDFAATCERGGASERVSLLLVGPQPVGTSVLVHNGTAVRVLGEAEARQIDDALAGVAAALEGRAFEHLFADLIEREPELPAVLKPAGAATGNGRTKR
ncbi:HypC/HybG/HupF family hydrogenase formation chaperone [Blastochloris viridis]|uniref:Hydrogenase isoenzymes formation protein hypC n=1 Tax=Blastochloris viridis TaxID=1079 RepID=A0A0H5BF82_BLAVI|nr:HypC/HybG/HupF family hydrogenase formation chaperone [Blastochloris viridis]ALK10307.1 Hydrogenase isoenzymes formation protein HypC [Blastochloris viridis]BAR99759.1 hydrogenase maturation protein HupF/HypC/HoxL [Blastochloris viridis]CUU42969.1 Hydrogenase isoenzymes formation protein hypC [Blastochloris viridis]